MKHKYKGNWVRVIDGNTLILSLDLGLRTFHVGPFQLLGVDASPASGKTKETGLKEKEKLETVLLQAGELIVETHKPDKYGRWLADLYYTDEHGVEQCINKLLTES